MNRGSISIEYLISILMFILVVTIFYNALHNITLQAGDSIKRAMLHDQASSTSLLATLYTYSLRHSDYELNQTCLISSKVYCVDEDQRIGSAYLYKRKGGGG